MDEDIRQLLQKNLELTEQIARDMRKVRHHFWMANVWSILKIFVFIVVPTYLSYVYLKPYVGQLQGVLSQVQELQKNVSGFQQNLGGLQKGLGALPKLPEGGSGGIPSLDQLKNIPGLESLFGGKK